MKERPIIVIIIIIIQDALIMTKIKLVIIKMNSLVKLTFPCR